MNDFLFDNPLLDPDSGKPFDHIELNDGDPAVCKRPDLKKIKKMETRRLSAKDALADMEPGFELFVLTKGQFSVVDVMETIIDDHLEPPVDLTVSTWNLSLEHSEHFIRRYPDTISNARWLFDLSYHRRSPGAAAKVREAFGRSNIRLGQNHAKFILFDDHKTKIVMLTTANINLNPRFETIQISYDIELYSFLSDFMDSVFDAQSPDLFDRSVGAIKSHWRNFQPENAE